MSQFVIIYGPGAIIEGREGPRVILRPDLGIFNQQSGYDQNSYRILDPRMSASLLGPHSSIFRLPSNAEVHQSENRFIYRTKAFPEWRLCIFNHLHGGNFSILYNERSCPVCNSVNRQTQESIRFIVACSRGHMDDIDWYLLVHHRMQGCGQVRWFRWFGGGGTLNDIRIECPVCRSSERMGMVYGQAWPCRGRYPENELHSSPPVRSHNCTRGAYIIQRQASNLRIPELITLLSIPPWSTNLHHLLKLTAIDAALAVTGGASSEHDLRTKLERLVSANHIPRNTLDEILSHPWNQIQQAIQDNRNQPSSNSYSNSILEEFHAFITYSVEGYPAEPAEVSFEIDRDLVQRVPALNGNILRITPVLTLRTVTVQRGYRREVDPDNNRVADITPVSFSDSGQSWYPGVDNLGEGIFIMLDSNNGWHYNISNNFTNEWNKAFVDRASYPADMAIFRGGTREELHPIFVWWHTFSHLLIRSLSIEAGYSSAAIRERIYFESDGTRIRGGILLYATEPGSEGTLGGLIALVPSFRDVMERALVDMLQVCSRDPLCIENHYRNGMYNGAACHGCLLISETSCEHRNMWLDRNVLSSSLP